MSLVLFFRGVNVGGHKAFSPSALAKKLAPLDVVNIGAAGTFVVRDSIREKALRAALARHLPFEAELMICKASDITKLHADDPFPDHPDDATFKRYVSVLAKRVSKMPKLPMCRPDDDDWQVKLFAASGRFILSLHRRQGKRLIYPNEVVEKALGVSATTRNWNTIESIVKSLNAK